MPGLAYCVGGRSLYWGGWAPRLTAADLTLLPVGWRIISNANYNQLEREIGVDPSTDFITGALYTALRAKLNAVAPRVANIDQSVEGSAAGGSGTTPRFWAFQFR
jgi:hypothetical protein